MFYLVFSSNFSSGDERRLSCLGCYFVLFEIKISGINIWLWIWLKFQQSAWTYQIHTFYIASVSFSWILIEVLSSLDSIINIKYCWFCSWFAKAHWSFQIVAYLASYLAYLYWLFSFLVKWQVAFPSYIVSGLVWVCILTGFFFSSNCRSGWFLILTCFLRRRNTKSDFL